MGDPDNSNNFSLDRIIQSRLTIIIIAMFLGVPANQFYQNLNPEAVRPDKFTGEMARQMEMDIKGWVNLRMRPMDDHLIKANEGWKLIYEMHEDIAVMKHKIDTLIKQHDKSQQQSND